MVDKVRASDRIAVASFERLLLARLVQCRLNNDTAEGREAMLIQGEIRMLKQLMKDCGNRVP
jgi:hypothetical protein